MKDLNDPKCYLRPFGYIYSGQKNNYPPLSKSRHTDVSCKIRRHHGNKSTEELALLYFMSCSLSLSARQLQWTKKIQKEHLKKNTYRCLQLVFRGRMENEAKRKCQEVETTVLSSNIIFKKFVWVFIYTEVKHCWVTTAVALLSINSRLRSEDSCNTLEAL